MKRITLTRSRQFVGAAARCWLVVNMNEDEAKKTIYTAIKKLSDQSLPDQSKNVIPIIAGQSVTIELNDNKAEFYVAFMIAFWIQKSVL